MNPSVLRLIDANANRAREGLRVLEDYARFVLDSGPLSADLKAVRHELAAAVAGVVDEAILHRDTPGDVGTANKTETELGREDVAHVVTAAGKRLGEALRAIEEFAKVSDPTVARRVEGLRYRFYEIERRIALTLRPANEKLAAARLYVLITESACAGDWYETAAAAIDGGAEILQLREKDLEGGELLRRAKRFVELCRSRGVISIINDRPDVAVLSDADGVHVGQGDLPASEARKIVGRDRILGVSTHEIGHARQAVLDGADYIGVGPFFRSPTKPRDFTAGPEYARQVAAEIRLPAFAIAGITSENVGQVVATGIQGIAVTAAVTRAADVAAAARALRGAVVSPIGQACLPAHASASVGIPAPGGSGIAAPSRRGISSSFSAGGTDIPVCGGRDIPVPATRSDDQVRIRRRNLPHWELTGRTYFLTFRLGPDVPDLQPVERQLVLDHIRSGHGRFYALLAAVVLPDHVHLLLRPNGDVDLARILKGTKGVSAHRVNQQRGCKGQLWQDESYDRIVRNAEEFDEKLQYMLENPVRAGLVEDGWEYDAWFCNTGAS